jgi:pantothenate kinase
MTRDRACMAQKMIPHNPDFLLMEGNNLTKEKLN